MNKYHYCVNTFNKTDQPVQLEGHIEAESEEGAIQSLIDNGVICPRSYEFLELVKATDGIKYDLIVFCFETGDASVPYWQEIALVGHDKMDYGTLEDSISSYMDSDACEDKEYEEMVEDVLNASGWPWSWFTAGASVQEVHTYWI